MSRYLLDTNIISELVRNPQGPVAAKIRAVGEAKVCTSIIVAAEMRFGVIRKSSPRLTMQVDKVLGALDVMPFEEPAEIAYGELRHQLETAGTPIGANDMLIAAHAMAQGLTVVTDNVREFRRVEGLRVENWL